MDATYWIRVETSEVDVHKLLLDMLLDTLLRNRGTQEATFSYVVKLAMSEIIYLKQLMQKK